MRIQRYSYSTTKFAAKQFDTVAAALPLPSDSAVTWLDIDGHLSTGDFEQLATASVAPVEIQNLSKAARPRLSFIRSCGDYVEKCAWATPLSCREPTIILRSPCRYYQSGTDNEPVREELKNDQSDTQSWETIYCTTLTNSE